MRLLRPGVSQLTMKNESKQYRYRVIEEIELLASPSAQMKYERDVPIADVPAELICGFANDLYQPKSDLFLNAFTEEELKSLAELYGMICIASKVFNAKGYHTVSEIQKVPEWRSVMSFAKDLVVELKRNG